MRTRIIIAGLFLSLSLLSCKNDKKEDVVKEEKPITFDVVVDLVIPTDDELILLYKDGPGEFIDSKTIWYSIKGSPSVQKATFSLPEGVMPTDFRLDIGRNEFKGLAKIEIKKVVLSYEDRKLEIKQDDINSFFEYNQYINFNEKTKTYTFKKDENGAYDPYFSAKPNLYSDIKKIAGYTM